MAIAKLLSAVAGLLALSAVADPDAIIAHAQIIRRALRMADLSLEKASITQAIDKSHKSHFNRQLAGEGHISLSRLLLLPQAFLRWYFFLGAMEYGLPEDIERGLALDASLDRALNARQQLRMTAEPSPERKFA